MSRKPTKGYYVKGHFVAEGSDLDLELKREQKGQDLSSKTDLKRESTELQKLGEDLLELRQDAMLQLVAQEHVPEALHEAIREAKKITNFEGKRRQMQFVGKLMRKLDDDQVQAIRAALDVQHNGSAEETLACTWPSIGATVCCKTTPPWPSGSTPTPTPTASNCVPWCAKPAKTACPTKPLCPMGSFLAKDGLTGISSNSCVTI